MFFDTSRSTRANMSDIPSLENDRDNRIPENSSSSNSENFINEDYGNIKTHILRQQFFQVPEFDIFNDNKYIISNVISFNINKDYHFINNGTTPCIYFNQISQHKEHNDDFLFLNTILDVIQYKSKSLDKNDRTKIFLETLFNKNLEVNGYRFWCFYFTTTVKDDNLLEQNFQDNMRKRTIDLVRKNKKVKSEFNAQHKKRKLPQQEKDNLDTKTKIYKYLNINENIDVFKVIREYLHYDKNCIRKSINLLNHGLAINLNNNKFSDNLLDELDSNFDNDSSKYLNLLSKESSMIYFIKNINDKQTNLSNYFNMNKSKKIIVPTEELDNLDKDGDDDSIVDGDKDNGDENEDEDDDSEERLNNLRSKNIKNVFKSFPFPNTVYEINTSVLLPEIFYGIPLPHSINICLSYKRILNQSEGIRKDLEVVGLHDMYIIPELPEFYDLLTETLQTPEIELIKTDVLKQIEDSKLYDSPLYYRLNCIKKYGEEIFPIFESVITHEINRLITERFVITSFLNIKKNNFGFNEPKIVLINDNIKKQLEEKRNTNLGYIEDASDDDDDDNDNDDEINSQKEQDVIFDENDPLDQVDSKTEFHEYCSTKQPVNLKNVINQSPLTSWWAKVLEKFTPPGFNINNISELQKNSSSIPVEFIKFDVFLRLQILNKIRYRNLRSNFKFRDKKEHQHYISYPLEYRRLQDAMAAECFYYFFTCDKTMMSEAFIGIRDWILLNQNEFKISDPKWKMNLRPFGQFMTWVVDFLNSVGQISNNLKIAILLYFCKFHHARYFSIANTKERNKVKLNVLLLGDGMSGKSHVFKVIQYTCAAHDKCVRDVMHSTDGCNNVDGNYDGFLRMHDEFNSKNWMEGDNTNPQAREQLKNVMTNHKTETIALVLEKLLDEDGNSYTKRDQKTYKASMQMVLFCASNNNSSLCDPNILTRYLVVRVPKTRKETDEANANHYKYNSSYTDLDYDEELYKQHQILHATLVIMEKMIQAGVYEDYNYGVEISGGESALQHILDNVQRMSGVNTSDHRKRVHQLEIARSMALAYACWMGMVSPFNQYLFEHNNTYVGFNHRILTMGIMPWSVITSDQVAAVSQLLNFNFQETFLEEILQIISLKLCKVLNSDDNSKCFYCDPKEHTIDYSYIYVTANSMEELAKAIQCNFADQTLSTHNIISILINLTNRYKLTYSYKKNNIVDNYLYLQRDKTTNIPIIDKRPVAKIEEYGRGKRMFFLSVSFLKEMFPTTFNNKFIESDKENLLNSNIINDDENNNTGNEIDLDSCFILNNNSNPFAAAFKLYYENKYLGHIDPYFTYNDKKEYAEAYTEESNKKKRIIPLRYITPEPPKDYLLSYNKLPNGLTNVVKLNKVMTVIELNLLNSNQETIEYNLQPYLPSERHGIRSDSFIKRTDGTYKLMQMNQTILNNNSKFIHEQKCDHDFTSCHLLLKKLHFPGYITLDDTKFFNWPLKTYHELYQYFIRDDAVIKQTPEDKFLYPEVNIQELVRHKKLLLDTEINKLNKQHEKIIVDDNKNKLSILKFKNPIDKRFDINPPQEIISYEILKKKIHEDQKKKIKEDQLNLKKQMELYKKGLTQKTSSSKKTSRTSDDTNKRPSKKSKKI